MKYLNRQYRVKITGAHLYTGAYLSIGKYTYRIEKINIKSGIVHLTYSVDSTNKGYMGEAPVEAFMESYCKTTEKIEFTK